MNDKNKTVTVTGGTGFVGQGLVAELLRRGYKVNALVRSQRSAEKIASHAHLRFILGEATKQQDIERALVGSSALFHLVGIRRREMKKANLTYDDVDVVSANAAVKACESQGVKRMLLLSAALLGNSTYVQSKRKAEAYLQQSSLEWSIFRPAFIIAPGQQWPIIMGPMLDLLALLPGRLGQLGQAAGNVTRQELVNAMIWAYENDSSIGQTFGVRDIREAGQRSK